MTPRKTRITFFLGYVSDTAIHRPLGISKHHNSLGLILSLLHYNIRDHSTIRPANCYGFTIACALVEPTSLLHCTSRHSYHLEVVCVYKINTRSEGAFMVLLSITTYKFCLVACGFQQEQCHDYEGTFANVAHMTTVATLLITQWSINLCRSFS